MILPPGTTIVTRVEIRDAGEKVVHPRGAVGMIVRSAVDLDHAYRVRFLDGFETGLLRDQFEVLKQVQREVLQYDDGSSALDLREFVIYRCVIGSRAYGLDRDDSDFDRRGIFLPPAERHWSLIDLPEQLEDNDAQEAYWELQKFLTLALKANPNVLECLYTPIVEHATALAHELLGMREAFLSKLIYQTYNGYVLSQFRKLESDLRNHGAVKWKHAMHLIRLLLAGIVALRERRVPVSVEEHRDRLLAIRSGETNWNDVDAWRKSLHRDFDAAFAATTLPERPDYAAADAYLIRARRSRV